MGILFFPAIFSTARRKPGKVSTPCPFLHTNKSQTFCCGTLFFSGNIDPQISPISILAIQTDDA